MKVFVYSKRASKKIATITNVATVKFDKTLKIIYIITESNEKFSFSTTEIKTTIYQN